MENSIRKKRKKDMTQTKKKEPKREKIIQKTTKKKHTRVTSARNATEQGKE